MERLKITDVNRKPTFYKVLVSKILDIVIKKQLLVKLFMTLCSFDRIDGKRQIHVKY